jgi:hypothetical protein
MVRINVNIEGAGSTKTELKKGLYSGGGIALRLIDTEDGAPFATLTVNLPDYKYMLKEGEFFIKTWSENASLTKALKESNKIFINTGRQVSIGMNVTAEIWKFANPKILDRIPTL